MKQAIQASAERETVNHRVVKRVLMAPDFRADNPYQRMLSNQLKGLGIDVVFPRGYRRILPLLREILLHRPLPNVLHLHWLTPYLRRQDLLGYSIYCLKILTELALLKVMGVRIVWTVHNLQSHESASPKAELRFNRWVARIADALIVHDEATRLDIVERYNVRLDKVSVIHHGHYRDAYGPLIIKDAARHHLKIPDDEFVFLFLGMLRPYKGLEELLQQWGARRSDLGENSRLIIAGASQDKEYGQRLAGLAAGVPNVQLEDRFIPDVEIPLYYSAADVAVFPFKRITTSGSLLLAISYNKPFIAPAFPQISNLTAAGRAFTFAPQQPASLGQALVHSRHSSELQEISSKVEEISQSLDWSVIGNKTATVYFGIH